MSNNYMIGVSGMPRLRPGGANAPASLLAVIGILPVIVLAIVLHATSFAA